jgi:KDO2-lipid IV(A) lauroyltransferase
MRIKHVIEYSIFELTGFVVRLVPLRNLPIIAVWFVRIVSPILQSRKKVALQNLRNAFPDKLNNELHKIASDSFKSVAITFLELLWSPRLSREQILQRVIIDESELLSIAKYSKRGVIYLTAHYGNWEMTTQSIAIASDAPLYVIVKTQSNILVDNKITKWRTQFGAKIIPMGLAVREIIRSLQNNNAVFLAADQTAPQESISVEFFGRNVPTFQGPAVFCLKSGAPIVLVMTVRQPDGRYKLIMEKVPSEDLEKYSESNVLELTRRQVKMTEEIIRRNPEQWMWMHKRWKHVPDRPRF